MKLLLRNLFILIFLSFYLIRTFCQESDNIKLDTITSDSLVGYEQSYFNNFGNEVEVLNREDLMNTYSTNFMNVLKGKVPGVEIIQGTNTLGSSSVLFYRGTRDMLGNGQPLIVLNGIPVHSYNTSVFNVDLGNILNNLSLYDIESVKFLKSGLATTEYGYRGGNGALIIDTRKTDKRGLIVSYNTSFLINRPSVLPKFQNEYGEGYNQEFEYINGIDGGEYDMNWGPKLDGRLIPQFNGPSTGYVSGQVIEVRGGDSWAREQAEANGYDNIIEPTPWIAQPDNVKDFFKTGFTFGNNLNVGWANQKGGINVSISKDKTSGILPNNRFSRNTVNANISYSFFNRLKLFTGIVYSDLNDYNSIIFDSQNSIYSPMEYFAEMGRQINIESLKDYWQKGREGEQYFHSNYRYSINPYFIVNESKSKLTRNIFNSYYGAKLDIIKGLTMSYVGGYENFYYNLDGYSVQNNITLWEDMSTHEQREIKNRVDDIYLDFVKNISQFKFEFTTGSRFTNYDGNSSYLQRSLSDLVSTGGLTAGESKVKSSVVDYYGNVNLLYRDLILISSGVSKSAIGIDEKDSSPYNKSFSTSFYISELLRLPEFISFLNLQAGAYNSCIRYVKRMYFFTSLNNSFSTIKGYNYGLSLSLLNQRLSIYTNYYSSKSENLFYLIALSPNSGFDYRIVDGSSTKNFGYEFRLNIDILNTQNLDWKLNINYFRNKNKVEKIVNNNILSISQKVGKSISVGSAVGETANEIFGERYLKEDGQIVYNSNGIQGYGDYGSIGSTDPDKIIYIGNRIKYKEFVFALYFDIHRGGLVYSDFYRSALFAGSLEETLEGRENGIIGDGLRWDEASEAYVENDIAVTAFYYFARKSSIDESGVFDASYVKLQEVSISYPIKFQKLQINCALFGQNIYTWTSQKHFDPSVITLSEGKFYRGVDSFNLPSMRVFGIRLGATFNFSGK